MAAKETYTIMPGHYLQRFEKSILLNGQSIYFEQPVTDAMWIACCSVIGGALADAFNDGVDHIRKEIKGVLGI